MEVERTLTGYRLPLDRATVDLLRGQVLDLPNTMGVAPINPSGLEYAVLWDRDNEYVHKAVKRVLRQAIKEAKAVAND